MHRWVEQERGVWAVDGVESGTLGYEFTVYADGGTWVWELEKCGWFRDQETGEYPTNLIGEGREPCLDAARHRAVQAYYLDMAADEHLEALMAVGADEEARCTGVSSS